MASTYTYGPLKSSYFTQFEKLWLEGYCKENKITLTENNIATVFAKLIDSRKPSKELGNKIQKLLTEAAGFSKFVKTSFNASWNRVLDYSMKMVTSKEALTESQIPAVKKDCSWWLKEAPKAMSHKISRCYFDGIVLECVSGDGEILSKLKTMARDGHVMLDRIQKSDPFTDKVGTLTMGKFMGTLRERFPVNEVLANEPTMRLLPHAASIVNTAAWIAENLKRLEAFQ